MKNEEISMQDVLGGKVADPVEFDPIESDKLDPLVIVEGVAYDRIEYDESELADMMERSLTVADKERGEQLCAAFNAKFSGPKHFDCSTTMWVSGRDPDGLIFTVDDDFWGEPMYDVHETELPAFLAKRGI
jgi:hypothetical protein